MISSLTPEEAIEKYKGLVHKIARSYTWKSDYTSEDLTQIGFIGLIKALRSYDSSLGKSSYIFACIKGEILNHIRDHGHLLKISRRIQREQQTPKDPLSLSWTINSDSESDEPTTIEFFLGREDPELERAEIRILVDLVDLTKREKYVLQRYFWDDLSESVIAKELHFSQMHINRIKQKALRKLREGIIHRNRRHQILQNEEGSREVDGVRKGR